MIDSVRSLIRPIVTVMCVGAFLLYAHYDAEAFGGQGPPAPIL